MTIKIHDSNGRLLNYSKFVFSGGEIQIKLELDLNSSLTPLFASDNTIQITAIIHDASTIIELLLVTDALRNRYRGCKIELDIPYFPFARQDRVCADGEAFSLKVMCDLINMQKYDAVYVNDVHSNVTLDLLNNSFNIPCSFFIKRKMIDNSILVSPDKGAVGRVSECARLFDKIMIVAEKVRDPNTGNITGTKIIDFDKITSNDFMIIDDICDGGRTFIELAKVLKPLTTGKIKLFVTHGIFSKGFEVFEGLIDEIYTAFSFIEEKDLPAFVHIVY